MKESSLKVQSWSQLGNPQCRFVIILQGNITIWMIVKKHSSLKEVGFIWDFPTSNHKWKVRFSLYLAMFSPSQSSFPSFPLHWSTSNLTMCHFAFLRCPTTQLTQPALWCMHILLCCEICFVSLCDDLILLLLGFTLVLLCSVMVKCFPTQLSLSREKSLSETSLNLWFQEDRWML